MIYRSRSLPWAPDLLTPDLGPTHHACEDIAFLSALPNMVVICPGDAWEVRAALRAAMKQDKPVYLRMGKKGEPKVHQGPVENFADRQGDSDRRRYADLHTVDGQHAP